MKNIYQDWNIPLAAPVLETDAVHLWCASLQVPSAIFKILLPALSESELAHAERFHFERDRHRYSVAHAVLRFLLARYTSLDPKVLHFYTNEYGKPALDPAQNPEQLHFNLSHSHELALFAFSYKREVGVDLEYKRHDIDYDQLAAYCFSPYERSVLATLSQVSKREAFYNCWTRKEAYIKARGMGLSLALDLFDVSLLPDEPAALLASREDAQEVERWSLQAVRPEPEYAGALAVEGNGWQLHSWLWSPSLIDR